MGGTGTGDGQGEGGQRPPYDSDNDAEDTEEYFWGTVMSDYVDQVDQGSGCAERVLRTARHHFGRCSQAAAATVTVIFYRRLVMMLSIFRDCSAWRLLLLSIVYNRSRALGAVFQAA